MPNDNDNVIPLVPLPRPSTDNEQTEAYAALDRGTPEQREQRVMAKAAIIDAVLNEDLTGAGELLTSVPPTRTPGGNLIANADWESVRDIIDQRVALQRAQHS